MPSGSTTDQHASGAAPDLNGASGGATSSAAADARVLRRAGTAGLVTFLVLASLLLGANALFGGGPQGALVWVSAAFVVGALVTAGWLVLVLILDMVAGELPSLRRGLWTVAAFVIAFISPILPAAALQAAAGS